MLTRSSLFVDTSGWAELADRRQPNHRAMQAIYQQATQRGRPIVTTNYVLAELEPLLADRLHFARPSIFPFVRAIKSANFVTVVHVSEDIDGRAWDMLERFADKEWSLVDAASFVVMHDLAITEALTTDHHFNQAGFTRLPLP